MKLLLLNLNPSTHRSDKDVTFSYIIYMLSRKQVMKILNVIW